MFTSSDCLSKEQSVLENPSLSEPTFDATNKGGDLADVRISSKRVNSKAHMDMRNVADLGNESGHNFIEESDFRKSSFCFKDIYNNKDTSVQICSDKADRTGAYSTSSETNNFITEIDTFLDISKAVDNIPPAALEKDNIRPATTTIDNISPTTKVDNVFSATTEINNIPSTTKMDTIPPTTSKMDNIPPPTTTTEKDNIPPATTEMNNVPPATLEIDSISARVTESNTMIIQLVGGIRKTERADITNRHVRDKKINIDKTNNWIKVINEEEPNLTAHKAQTIQMPKTVPKYKRVDQCCSNLTTGIKGCVSCGKYVPVHNYHKTPSKAESAISLVRSYVTELERVASRIETILKSYSPVLTTNPESVTNTESSMTPRDNLAFEQHHDREVFMTDAHIVKEHSLEHTFATSNMTPGLTSLQSSVNQASPETSAGSEHLRHIHNMHEECKIRNVAIKNETDNSQSTEQLFGEEFRLEDSRTNYGFVMSCSESSIHDSVEALRTNTNNNSICDVSAGLNDCCNVRIKVKQFWVNDKGEKNKRVNYDINKTRKGDTMGQTSKPFVCTKLQKTGINYENTNNNGNFTIPRKSGSYGDTNNSGNAPNSTTGTCALSAGMSHGSTIEENGCNTLKKRTQELKRHVSLGGNEVVIVDGKKVYSINQKTMKSNELIYNDCDIDSTKDQIVDTHKFVDKNPTELLRVNGSSVVVQMTENRVIQNTEKEKSIQLQSMKKINQTHDSEIFNNNKRPYIAKTIMDEMTQSEWNARLDNDSCSINQQVRAKTMSDVPQDKMMLNVDTVDSSKDDTTNFSTKRELQSMKTELTKEKRDENNIICRQKSNNTVSVSRKSEGLNELCVDNSRTELFKHLSGDCNRQVSKVTQQDQSMAISRTRKTSGRKTRGRRISEVDRWATAIGKTDIQEIKRLSDVSTIKHLRKEDFPLIIRPIFKPGENDTCYVPERTRRLTIESPAENLLVHTSYIRLNPHQKINSESIEMVSHRKLYLGQEDEIINTNGTRRLICETECFSCKDPKTHNLVIENGELAKWQNETSTVPVLAKDASVAVENRELALADGIEMLKDGSNEIVAECINRFSSSCIRMIGDYVVIGTGTRNSSITKMIQNQNMKSITAGDESSISSKPIDSGEAGDGMGDNAQKKLAITDCSRVAGSGDHLMLEKKPGDSNNSNSNVYLQGRLAGVYREILPYKTALCMHNNNYKVNAVAFDRTFFVDKKSMSNSGRRYNDMDYCGLSCEIILADLKNSLWEKSTGANMDICSTDLRKLSRNLEKGIQFNLLRFHFLSADSEFPQALLESNRNNSSAREESDLHELGSNSLTEIIKPGSSDRPGPSNRPGPSDRSGSSDRSGPSDRFRQSCHTSKCHEYTDIMLSWSHCSICDQVTENDSNMGSTDFMNQVMATDINPTAATQTWEYTERWMKYLPVTLPKKMSEALQETLLMNPKKENSFDESEKIVVGHYRKYCQFGCEFEFNNFNIDSSHEMETQVKATEINPSKTSQTENEDVLINPFFRSGSELSDITAENTRSTLYNLLMPSQAQSSEANVKTRLEVIPYVADPFPWYPKQQVSMSNQNKPQNVANRSQHSSSRSQNSEHFKRQSSRNENFGEVIAPNERSQPHLQEASLVRQDNIAITPGAVNVNKSYLQRSPKSMLENVKVSSLSVDAQDNIVKTREEINDVKKYYLSGSPKARQDDSTVSSLPMNAHDNIVMSSEAANDVKKSYLPGSLTHSIEDSTVFPLPRSTKDNIVLTQEEVNNVKKGYLPESPKSRLEDSEVSSLPKNTKDNIVLAPEEVSDVKENYWPGSTMSRMEDSTVTSNTMNTQDNIKDYPHLHYTTEITENSTSLATHNEELYSGVPTSGASTVVLYSPPVYGSTQLKEHLPNRYKNRLLGGNIAEATEENETDETADDQKKGEEMDNGKIDDDKRKRTHTPYKRRRRPNDGPSVSTQTDQPSSYHQPIY